MVLYFAVYAIELGSDQPEAEKGSFLTLPKPTARQLSLLAVTKQNPIDTSRPMYISKKALQLKTQAEKRRIKRVNKKKKKRALTISKAKPIRSSSNSTANQQQHPKRQSFVGGNLELSTN